MVSAAEYFENSARPRNPGGRPPAQRIPAGRRAVRAAGTAPPRATRRRADRRAIPRFRWSRRTPAKVQHHDRPETRPLVGHQAGNPPHQDLGQREQQDERQAHRPRRLGAKQMRRTPGQPPARRGMIEIAETEHASGCHHIALVHPQPGRRGERQPDQRCSGDQPEIGESLMECGCFCCLQTFAATEVIDWIDDGDTPFARIAASRPCCPG